MSERDTVLVVAAHPDDEVLGCGGTIARHAALGREVHVLFVADGETSRNAGEAETEELVAARRGAAEKACRMLGARPPLFVNLPDQRLDSIPLLEITQAIERQALPLAPRFVYTHHIGDLNLDHRLVAHAVLTAFRPTPGRSAQGVYGFEIPSSTEWSFSDVVGRFHPSRFVPIAAWLSVKLAALAEYDVEMRPFPHPRSYDAVEMLAKLRGATVGLEAAEALMVYWEIEI